MHNIMMKCLENAALGCNRGCRQDGHVCSMNRRPECFMPTDESMTMTALAQSVGKRVLAIKCFRWVTAPAGLYRRYSKPAGRHLVICSSGESLPSSTACLLRVSLMSEIHRLARPCVLSARVMEALMAPQL